MKTSKCKIDSSYWTSHLLFISNLKSFFGLYLWLQAIFSIFGRVVLLNGPKALYAIPGMRHRSNHSQISSSSLWLKFWRTSNQKMPKILKLTTTEQHPLLRIERLSFPVMESSPAMGPIHFWDSLLVCKIPLCHHQIPTPLTGSLAQHCAVLRVLLAYVC